MKRYLYVEEPEGEFCQLNMTLDEFYHTSHKIDNQQKEIERLQSNCKTLAKMLDKEIENKRKVLEYINRYLELNLSAFDTRVLLEKMKEILEGGNN